MSLKVGVGSLSWVILPILLQSHLAHATVEITMLRVKRAVQLFQPADLIGRNLPEWHPDSRIISFSCDDSNYFPCGTFVRKLVKAGAEIASSGNNRFVPFSQKELFLKVLYQLEDQEQITMSSRVRSRFLRDLHHHQRKTPQLYELLTQSWF